VRGEGGSEVVQVVQVAYLDGDLASGAHAGPMCSLHGRSSGQEWPHDRVRIGFQLVGGSVEVSSIRFLSPVDSEAPARSKVR
jgi:hypothetical protein